MKSFDKKQTTDLVIGVMANMIDHNAVSRLLKAGANPDAWVSTGVPIPNFLIRRNCDLEMIRILLKGGASPATVNDKGEGLVANYLQSGTFVEYMEDDEEPEGVLALLNLFLEYDVPIDIPDEQGTTPLMRYCREYNKVYFVDYLVHAGADVNARNVLGITPLLFALSQGVEDRLWTSLKEVSTIAEYLLQAGASIHSTADNGLTPIGAAIESANYLIIPLLLSKGASTATVASTVYLEPIFAAVAGDLDRLDKAFHAGKNINVRNSRLQTALMWAAAMGEVGVVSYLLDKGGDVNARDEHGWTPLFYAVNQGHDAVCRLLLAHGSDPNHRVSSTPYGTREYTAINWLLERNFKGSPIESVRSVYRLLLDYGASKDEISLVSLKHAGFGVEELR